MCQALFVSLLLSPISEGAAETQRHGPSSFNITEPSGDGAQSSYLVLHPGGPHDWPMTCSWEPKKLHSTIDTFHCHAE